MFALFGSTLTLRAHVLPTDELIFGDKAADASGQTARRVLATNVVYKNSVGKFVVTAGNLNFANNTSIEWKNTGGTDLGMFLLNSGNNFEYGPSGAFAGRHQFYSGGALRLLLDAAGLLVIGSNTAAAYGGSKLRVDGFMEMHGTQFNINTGGAQFEFVNRSAGGHDFYVNSGTTLAVRVQTNGYVGIGAATALVPLHIRRTAAAVPATPLMLQNANDVTGAATDLDFSTHSGDVITGRIRNIINGANDYHLVFFTYLSALTERMRITDVGHVLPGADNNQTMGSASKRWSVVYAGTGTINTSDERAKTEIGPIPDEWLDAWGDVEWSRFKMTGGRRWHVGLVAQRVHAVFAARDLDAFDIGLCCFDAWDEQTQAVYEKVTRIEKVEVQSGEVYKSGKRKGEPKMKFVNREFEESVDTGWTEVVLEAGDRWGLRYDECQAIEAAWQRREISKLKDQIALLLAGSSQAG